MSTEVLGFKSGKGTRRVVVTAPHGGKAYLPGVSKRCSPGCCTVEDSFTVEVADRVVSILKERGVDVYFIYTTITRSVCDFNRPQEKALDDPKVIPFYSHYHDTIRSHLDEMKPGPDQHCLLVDIHGQSEPGYKDKILRGTQNGKTMPLNDRGLAILQCFEREGLPLEPASADIQAQEHPNYNGGWTVRNYTSSQVDALQLEIGWDLRKVEAREDTCQKIAKSILCVLELPYYN
eukprot:TRINITY_DN1616_c0_g1_i7.p1 TRINITY_DN1616_c0_g1~~TRINITY_DN1616_c0_g1_i7.p1  ORF type:complete len:234 (-),score=47.40 TRINITY_DN1616_c0_g1_i7:87-788(-)